MVTGDRPASIVHFITLKALHCIASTVLQHNTVQYSTIHYRLELLPGSLCLSVDNN